MVTKKKIHKLDDGLDRLKKIAKKIEEEDHPIEHSLSLYEDALAISKEISLSVKSIEKEFNIMRKDNDHLIQSLD